MDFSFWTKFPPLELSGLLRSSKVDLISGSTAECWCDRHRGGSTWRPRITGLEPIRKTSKTSKNQNYPMDFLCLWHLFCLFFSLWVSFFCLMAQKKNIMSLILGQSFFCCLWLFDTWKVSAHLLFTWSKLTDADDVLGSWVTLNLSPREAVFDASALRIIRSSIRWNQRNFLGMKFRLPDDRSNF